MTVAEAIIKASDFQSDGCWLSVYRDSRCYGGPEEGGWWYTIRSLEGYIKCHSKEQAKARLSAVIAEVEKMNKDEAPQRYRAFAALPDEDLEPVPAGCGEGYIPAGWSDGGQLLVVIEDKLGEGDNTNQPKPRYE
jgi:hypothetical protein